MWTTEAVSLLEKFCEENNIAFEFSHFVEKVTPPFMAYFLENTDNFSADNKVYYSVYELEIELYTRSNTLDIEHALERFLTANGIIWERNAQQWNDEEKVMMSSYSLGEFGNYVDQD